MTGRGVDRRALLRTAGAATVALAGGVPAVSGEAGGAAQFSAGERIWSFETGEPIEASPTVVDETVYFGANDGNAYALDAETGEELWRFETDDSPRIEEFGDEIKGQRAVKTAPKVVDGTVYVGANDHHLYALDAETGEERWRFDTGRYVWGSPAVVDDTVYVSSRSHYLYALSASTGRPRWRGDLEFPSGAGVAAVDGRVHVGSYGEENFHTFDAETGELLWKKRFDSELCAAPAVHDGTVYTVFPGRPLYAFDAATGEEEWTFDGDLLPVDFGINESPTVWNGTVYVSNRDALYAVDADTGESVWEFEEGRMIHQTPTVADGVLFVGSHGETYLFAIDAESGEERWRFEAYGNIYASPTVVDGVVFFGSHDGYLHAVDAGVDGSSEDVLPERGIDAHHHSWVGDPEPDLEMVPDGDTYEPLDADFEPPYGGWFDDVPNYDGTVDRRGDDAVTIEVGAGPDGTWFDPPAVIVDPAIDIEFVWTGNGAHDVVEENGLWESELTDEEGYTFPLRWDTLETGDARLGTRGVYRYYCTPHRTQGMKGAITVGDIDAVEADVNEDATRVPGFGAASALASLGGAAYLLKRRLDGGDES